MNVEVELEVYYCIASSEPCYGLNSEIGPSCRRRLVWSRGSFDIERIVMVKIRDLVVRISVHTERFKRFANKKWLRWFTTTARFRCVLLREDLWFCYAWEYESSSILRIAFESNFSSKNQLEWSVECCLDCQALTFTLRTPNVFLRVLYIMFVFFFYSWYTIHANFILIKYFFTCDILVHIIHFLEYLLSRY